MMRDLIGFQFKLAIKRKELYIAFYIMLGLCIFSFLSFCFEMGSWYFSNDIIQQLPAYVTYIGHYSSQQYTILFIMLILLVIPLAFSDSSFVEKSNGINPLLFTRIKRLDYIISKGIAIFTIGFLLTFIPLFMNFIFNIIAFPLFVPRNYASNPSFRDVISLYSQNIFFLDLYLINPYICVALNMLLLSLYGAIASVVVYTISFFVKKYRAIVIGSLFISYHILSLLFYTLSAIGLFSQKSVQALNYLRLLDHESKFNFTGFIVLLVIVLMIAGIILYLKNRPSEDEL